MTQTEIETIIAKEEPLKALHPVHRVKIRMALNGVRLAKREDAIASARNTLELWNVRARRAGYPDAATWAAS